ncbi:hypothetical protein ACHWQZ_G011907 [Mnemiopsis leidyi]
MSRCTCLCHVFWCVSRDTSCMSRLAKTVLMFFLLLLPLGVDGDLQRPPLLWTTSSSSTTPPPATTQPHPPTLSPRVSWSLRNYTANITGPSTPTPGDKSLLSVSINYSFKGHFTQVILGGFTSSLPFVSKSSNDSTTKKIASGEVYTNYLTVPPTSDEKVKQNSESGENSRIVLNSGGYLTTSEPPDVTTRRTVDQSTEQLKLSSGYVGTNNSSSVCLFEDTKLRVFDVVVYLTVDLVFSVLALFLGGTLLLVWYRTKGGRLTNRSRLEGAWHLTYCTCCCVILAASFIFWSGAKVSFPLDLLLLCAHLLRNQRFMEHDDSASQDSPLKTSSVSFSVKISNSKKKNKSSKNDHASILTIGNSLLKPREGKASTIDTRQCDDSGDAISSVSADIYLDDTFNLKTSKVKREKAPAVTDEQLNETYDELEALGFALETTKETAVPYMEHSLSPPKAASTDFSNSLSNDFSPVNILTSFIPEIYHERYPKPIDTTDTSCSSVFICTSDLHYHMRKDHNFTPQWRCDKCQMTFLTEIEYEDHITKWQCPFCQEPKIFSLRRELVDHCSQKHRNADHDEKIKCNVCKLDCLNEESLQTHELKHHGNFDNILKMCPFCGVTDERVNLYRHIKSFHAYLAPKEKLFSCNLCGDKSSFLNKQSLQRHIECVHKKTETSECDVCHKKFAQKATMMRHRRIHLDIKPFKCDICDLSFTQKTGMRSHKERHYNKDGTLKSSEEIKVQVEIIKEQREKQNAQAKLPSKKSSKTRVKTISVPIGDQQRENRSKQAEKVRKSDKSDDNFTSPKSKKSRRINCNMCGSLFADVHKLNFHNCKIDKDYNASGETSKVYETTIENEPSDDFMYEHKCNKCLKDFISEKRLITHRCLSNYRKVLRSSNKSENSGLE